MPAIAYYSDPCIAAGGVNARAFFGGFGHGMGGSAKEVFIKGTFTAAPLITDYINLIWVPKGFRVTGCTISADDMDTSTGMTIDIGDSGDQDRLIAASAVAQANTLKVDTLRPTAISSGVITLGFGYKYTADTLLVATVLAAPSGTGSAGSIYVGLRGVLEATSVAP